MPNKEQILSIVRSTKSLLEFILNTIDENIPKTTHPIEDGLNLERMTSDLKDFKKKNSLYHDKIILISNKIMRFYLNLSKNIYGQSIILHSDFDTNGQISIANLKQNPSLNFNNLLIYISNNLKNLELNGNKISMNFLETIHNYMMIILICFYDNLYFEYAANYFDNNTNNTLGNNNLFTSDFISDLSKIKCCITDVHLYSLISSISGKEINKDNLLEECKNLQDYFININNYLENINDKYYQSNNDLYKEFNYCNNKENLEDGTNLPEDTDNINNESKENKDELNSYDMDNNLNNPDINLNMIKTQQNLHNIQNILDKLNLVKRNNNLIIKLLNINNKNNFTILELCNSENLYKPIKLPIARKIYEKCEIINKYYDFFQTQVIDYNLYISNQQNQGNFNNLGNNSPTNTGGLNNINPILNKLNELNVNKYQIMEFEKLLNWKKYRIYLSKLDNLNIRKDIFDLDFCLKILPEEKLLKQLNDIDFSNLSNTDFINKRLTYVNLDTFQQFCNSIINENLIVEKYSNISYSISKNCLNKKLIFSDSIDIDLDNLNDCIKKNFLSCYKYDFEFNRLLVTSSNLKKFNSGLKNIGGISINNQNSTKSKIKFYFLFFIIYNFFNLFL